MADIRDVTLDELDEVAEQQQSDKKESKATKLVKLALEQDIELFHNPEGEAYATIPVDGRRETYVLKTKAIRLWLARLFYETYEEAAGSQATQDALGVLWGQALFDGEEHPVHVRIAEHHGAVFLDLADAEWRAVEITPKGWRLMVDPPVRFKRARGMLPLPIPEPGGCIGDLRPFLNYGTEDAFKLMVSWLVMAFRGRGPYPVLALHGEQGSGKSTAAEVLRMLIDPNEAMLRPPPRDERDLVIAGSNGRVVALENLSHVAPWLSDALCRISTGAGFGTRELYSDSDEQLFAVQLPVVLNGIVEVITAGDLQDRSITLMLPTIDEYTPEEEMWQDFERVRPRLLGTLLDVVAVALKNEPTVKLERPPRMADFAHWTVAAAPALGWEATDLLNAYAANRATANETTLEASALPGPLRSLGVFEGTATELLTELSELAGENVARSKNWPKSPSALSGELRRLAPSLRRGEPPILIEFERDASGRTIRISPPGSK